MARASGTEPTLDLRPFIDMVGLKQVIDQVGRAFPRLTPEERIAHLETLLSQLTPEERENLKGRLQ